LTSADRSFRCHDLAVNNTVGIVTVDKGLKNITVDGIVQP
jgi:hypothetical protein